MQAVTDANLRECDDKIFRAADESTSYRTLDGGMERKGWKGRDG